MDESYLEWLRVLPGFSAEKARRVAERFPTFEHLRAATAEELASVEGLTAYDLEALHRLARDPRGRDADGHLFLCPECGSFAGPASAECPFCGVSFEEAEQEASVQEIDSFLKAEADPPLLCMGCGAVMEPGSTRCEVCGRSYTPQEAAILPGRSMELEAPSRFCVHCGAYLADGATECTICGFDRLKTPDLVANGHNGKGLAEGFLSRWQRVAETPVRTEMDRLGQELEQFEKILEADPALDRVWAKRGRLLAKMGRAIEAAESFSKAAELDPTRDEEYRLEVLDILQAKGDLSFLPPRWSEPRATAAPSTADARLIEALRHYEALLERDPEIVVAWRTKGEILERLGRTDEARLCSERADSLERHEGDLLKARVSGLQAQGIASPSLVARSNGPVAGHVNGRTDGHTNGRVNGLAGGRVNGLTNGAANGLGTGRGPTNGLGGFTNGRTNGLVNGNGFTNGRRGRYGPARIPAQPHWARSLVGIAAVVALMILVPVLASILTPSPGAYAPIAIDHNFSEWSRFTAYTNAPPANLNNPDINLLAVKVTTDPSYLYVYAKVQGLFFQAPWTNGTESLLVFVDTDHNPNTGYPVGALGADVLAVVTGWDGQIRSMGRYVFNESGVVRSGDFRRFLSSGTVDAAFLGDQSEMRIPLDTDPAQAHLLVYTADNLGNRDSMIGMIQPSHPTIVVSQTTVAPDTVRVRSTPFLRISLSAMGGAPTLAALSFARQGSSSDPANLSLFLDDGSGTFNANDTLLASAALQATSTRIPLNLSLVRPATLWAVTTWAGLTINTTFGLQVASAVGNGTSSLTPPETGLVYLGAAPTTPRVDGAFGDWAGHAYGADPVGDVVNRTGSYVYDANVDLLATAVDRGAEFAGFARVDGRMLGGGDIPNDVQRPGPNPPSSGNISNVTPPYVPQIGYDVLYAYIDADNSSFTGLVATAGNHTYGFDYALVVTGRNGTVASSALYTFASNGTWQYARPIAAALDAHRIEFGVNSSALNLTPGYRVVFYSTDWRLQYDVGLPDAMVKLFALGTQAIANGVVLNEISTASNAQWIEVANPGAQTVTLQGWTLTVQRGNTNTVVYTFGTVVLGPFGSASYLFVVNLPTNPLPRQTSTVSLNHGTAVVDQTSYPTNLGTGTSWARYKDPQTGQPLSSYNGGSAWYTSSSPTRGTANDRTGPVLSLSLTSNSRTATPGSYVTYTVGYSNTGDGVARTAWVNDTLPAGVTFVSSSVPYNSVSGSTYTWLLPNVSVASHSFTIRVQVNGVGVDGSSQVNRGTLVYTDQLSKVIGAGQAWRNVTIRRPQITVAKTVTPANAVPGQAVTFIIYYNNTGSRRASTVSILDVLPAGLTFQSSNPRPTAVSGRNYYWNFTNVGTGSHSITLTALVARSATGTKLVNWAYLNYSVNSYSLPGSKASAVVAIPELSDFLFVAAVPFLVIGLRMRSRRRAQAEQQKE
jgi:uncharacterized repeat protein (TIGR01451 family)